MRKSGVMASRFVIWSSKMYFFIVEESREWSDSHLHVYSLTLSRLVLPNTYFKSLFFSLCVHRLWLIAVTLQQQLWWQFPRTEGDLHSSILAIAQVMKENIDMLLDVSVPVVITIMTGKWWCRGGRRGLRLSRDNLDTVLKEICAERQQEQTGKGDGIQSFGWG